MHRWRFLSRRARQLACLAFALVVSATAGAQEPLMRDDFDDGEIDTTLWNVTLPYSNSPRTTVKETGGNLELFRRGIIDSVGSFPDQIDVEGRFRFTGTNDALSIVLRSDLGVTNLFERRGVQVALQLATGRVFLIPEPFASTPIPGAFLINRDTDIAFRVLDDGQSVRLYLQDFFQPVMSATITNRRGNKLSIYNLNGTTSGSRIDRVAVYPLQTTVFVDGTIMRTGLVQKAASAQIIFQSIYADSPVFYTLDGSAPSFGSLEYSGPFELSQSATIRAIAYTSDFLTASESAPVEFQYLSFVRLTNETAGGGVITFDPPGPYLSNQVVSLTAMPGAGWQFLRWEGAVDGTSVSNQVTMTNHLSLRAVFGTSPNITIIGAGQVRIDPVGSIIEYGTALHLLALPDAGNYFFRWANALNANTNPASFLVTHPNPGATALFSALATNQSSFTLLVEGKGTAEVSPAGNVFTNGQSVTLTARPDPGQIFLEWTGTAAGRTNPLSLIVNTSQVITARFAPPVDFIPAATSFGSNGFLLTMKGVPGFFFHLQRSSNFTDWSYVATLTNATGQLAYEHSEATNHPLLFYRIVGP